jgi:hypothetical protein
LFFHFLQWHKIVRFRSAMGINRDEKEYIRINSKVCIHKSSLMINTEYQSVNFNEEITGYMNGFAIRTIRPLEEVA